MLRVAEIFTSIQGEGDYQGRPANFIRLAGCNLDCGFCDEPIHKQPGTPMTEEEIVDELSKNLSLTVITGGEPTVQDLTKLLDMIQKIGQEIILETNGYKVTREYMSKAWVCVSPKGSLNNLPEYYNELKILVDTYSDIDINFLKQEAYNGTVISLQPLTGMTNDKENIAKAIKLCIENDFRYSPRLQNYLGVK